MFIIEVENSQYIKKIKLDWNDQSINLITHDINTFNYLIKFLKIHGDIAGIDETEPQKFNYIPDSNTLTIKFTKDLPQALAFIQGNNFINENTYNLFKVKIEKIFQEEAMQVIKNLIIKYHNSLPPNLIYEAQNIHGDQNPVLKQFLSECFELQSTQKGQSQEPEITHRSVI